VKNSLSNDVCRWGEMLIFSSAAAAVAMFALTVVVGY
jgi:hypothetical protein